MYIVIGNILNVSTVHLNRIWHLIWRYLSKPVLGGHYSIPRGCPLNTGFTVLAPFRPGRRHFETWASQGGMNVTELPRNKQQRKSTRSRSFLYSGTGTGTVSKFFGMSNWKRMCTETRDKCRISYPVHNWSPSFHCYALKDGYHSYCNVIKSRDAVVRTDPAFIADEAIITFSPAKYLSNSLKWSFIAWSGILFY